MHCFCVVNRCTAAPLNLSVFLLWSTSDPVRLLEVNCTTHSHVFALPASAFLKPSPYPYCSYHAVLPSLHNSPMYLPQAQGNYVSILEYIEDLVRVVAKGTATTSAAATPEGTGSGRGATGWMLPTPTCLLDELKTLANHPTDDGTSKGTREQTTSGMSAATSTWQCLTCTYEPTTNPASALVCSQCQTPRVTEVGGETKGETKGESASMSGGLMTEQSSSSMDVIDMGGEGSNTAGEEGVGCESKSPSNNAPGAGEEAGVETGAQTTDVDAMELAALMLQALANNYKYRDQPFRCCGDMPDALPWTSQMVASAASSSSSSVPFPATTGANNSSLGLFHVMDAPANFPFARDSGGEAKGVDAIESKESAEESTTPGEGDTVSFCVSGTVLLGGVGIPPRCIPTTHSEGGTVHALELVVNQVVVRNTKEQTHGIGESSGVSDSGDIASRLKAFYEQVRYFGY